MNDPLHTPHLSHLLGSPEFLCFVRSWWDGKGIDFLACWNTGKGYQKQVMRTGETLDAKQPTLLRDERMEGAEFRAILDQLKVLGVMRLPSQRKRLAYTHFDDWYVVKCLEEPTLHQLYIKGGSHAEDKDLRLLKYIYEICPELRLFEVP